MLDMSPEVLGSPKNRRNLSLHAGFSSSFGRDNT
jgi:hypothetical protein